MNALLHGTSGLQTHTARLCKASKVRCAHTREHYIYITYVRGEEHVAMPA